MEEMCGELKEKSNWTLRETGVKNLHRAEKVGCRRAWRNANIK
jgi:hypothetical protein